MRTVKVRIACAVNSRGEYHAQGWAGAEGEEAKDAIWDALEPDPGGEVVHWITAEVPVPEAVELAGTLEGEVPQ